MGWAAPVTNRAGKDHPIRVVLFLGCLFFVPFFCVCVKLCSKEPSRGVRHDCGTALNEATTIMGYRV